MKFFTHHNKWLNFRRGQRNSIRFRPPAVNLCEKNRTRCRLERSVLGAIVCGSEAISARQPPLSLFLPFAVHSYLKQSVICHNGTGAEWLSLWCSDPQAKWLPGAIFCALYIYLLCGIRRQVAITFTVAISQGLHIYICTYSKKALARRGKKDGQKQ